MGPMRIRTLCATVLLALPVLADESLNLAVGQQQVLPAGKVTRVSLADPGVAEATLVAEQSKRQILVTALKPGRTDLLLWEGEGAVPRRVVVSVAEFSPERFAAEIQALTAGIEGLLVHTVGDKVVLDGKLLTARDKERVDLIAKAYPQVLNLSTLDLEGHQDIVSEEIRHRVGSRDLVVQTAGGRAVLRGTVPTEADKTAAAQMAQAYYKEIVNELQVAPDMVEVEATFAHIQASDLKKEGQNLPADLSALLSGTAGTGQSPVYSASAKVPLLIEALKAQGKATVLAAPHLSTVSGTEASFHSGGEQGIRVSGTGVADVKFKKYGLLLKVKPLLLSDGRVRTSLSIEVSAPVEGAAGGEPAFTTFTTESEVVCAEGEAVVVSGLLESLKSKFREKTPILGSIPVLKAFFSTERESTEETRLILVILPRRACAVPAPASAAPGEREKILKDARQGLP